MTPTNSRTSLYETHLSLGARMVPFGGWDMPVQYAGLLGPSLVPVGDNHLRPFLQEPVTSGTTDARAAPGDNGYFVFQPTSQHLLQTSESGASSPDFAEYSIGTRRHPVGCPQLLLRHCPIRVIILTAFFPVASTHF